MAISAENNDGTIRNRIDQLPRAAFEWARQTALAYSRPDLTTEKDGTQSLNPGLRLNPWFVEWLMGWPTGWTASECSATELCRYRRLMQSALSDLALPPPAAPVQFDFFGEINNV